MPRRCTLRKWRTGSTIFLGFAYREGSRRKIPIFITFKDRITYLVETIRALHRNIRTPFEIVIIDDTSTFPAAVQFVERLVDSKVTVLRVPQYESGKFDSLYAVIARMITEYMKERSKADYFVWTDPDVPLDSAPGDILEVYAAALEGLEAHNVGAAIRNDNWTEDMRDNKHGNEQDFIKLPASCFVYREICYYYIHASIDTTFAMYRRNTVLQRLVGPTARMLSPLAVHHLDYLIDKTKIPEDVKYYVKRTKGDITHSWFKDHVEKSPS
ncbi:uncharacterized protein EV422DRAFT_362833 [Fimicolochytrium jonesii]|uniref:uncharacterized protein n=1 Tax=Fimicolochytrium jonesii TaxID=1396493 RepID=UPI0022FF0F2D|nr:uncharacterized protein EV422DRAFT_362833 [Fimicolochytrium jonesii]KAI8823627.1 hypothetical protein EV422DRAFT_362833 [Fimicolochytrium jonesii]